MRLTELHRKARRDLLLEMNVVNADAFTRAVTDALEHALTNRRASLPVQVLDLLRKRLTRAAINDEQGTMVDITPIDAATLGASAPAWLKAAIAKKQKIVAIAPKADFAAKMDHIVDWLIADQNPLEAIRTQPEQGLLDNLYAQADRFFAERNMRLSGSEDEGGREVVMTFRKAPNETAIHHYTESNLEPDERGVIIAFWCKLTSPAALDREGKLMRHCVGSYADAVANHGTTIYSLRDAANKPHVTVEAARDWDNVERKYGLRIRQIKGKQNQPPLGKYRPFVKTFMNELGLAATDGGKRDAKTVGLITQGGRYGEYHEVARLLHEFPSGARLMTLHEGATPAETRYSGGAPNRTSVETVYVLPDNSTALELDFYFPPERNITFEGATLRNTSILRHTPRQYPVWAGDLIPFLNDGIIGDGDSSLERLGIFRHGERWGRLPEVGEKLIEGAGLAGYQIEDRVLVVEASSLAPVATLDRKYTPSTRADFRIAPEEGNPLVGTALSHFLLEYARADEAGALSGKRRPKLSSNSGIRETMRGFGIIHFSAKQGWQSVSDLAAKDRKGDSVVRKSEFGSIVLYQQRWFFLGPDREFLGVIQNPDYIYDRELASNGPNVNGFALHWRTDAQGEKLLRLLASVQDKGDRGHPIVFTDFGIEKITNAGWVVRKGRLLHKSEVEQRRRLSDGAIAALEVTSGGGANLIIEKDNDVWVSVWTNASGVVEQKAKIDALDENPSLLAEALNAFHLGVEREDMLKLRLTFRNGHFVGLDREADADILAYARSAYGEGGYHAPQGWTVRQSKTSGYIYIGDQIIADFETRDEFSISMRKRLPDGMTRKDVVRAAAEVMHWWHDRIEPVYHDGPSIYRVTHGGAH